MSHRDPSPPPPYSRHGEEYKPIHTAHLIVTGPSEYPGSSSMEGLTYLFVFIKSIMKFICGGYMLNIMLKPKASSHPYYGLFLIAYLVSLVNCFNIWEQSFLTFRPFQTMNRFKICRPGYCLFGFSLFAVDCFFMLGHISIAICKLPEHGEAMGFVIVPNAALLSLNLFVFAVIHTEEIKDYAPLVDTAKYFLARRSENSLREKPLTIRESGSFRVVIENCGRNAWKHPLIIHRKISWTVPGNRGAPFWKREDVWFTHRLREPLEPGQIITFIPSTHHDESAYRIRGFRSFGKGKGELVETSVNNESYVELVTLREEYNVNELQARRNVILNFGMRVY